MLHSHEVACKNLTRVTNYDYIIASRGEHACMTLSTPRKLARARHGLSLLVESRYNESDEIKADTETIR